jgi:WD40 repeat protein
MVFDHKGAKAYLGTNSGLLGSAGLSVLDSASNSVTPFTAVPGKVLAVSPDGNKVVISDTAPADGPNRVFVFDTTNRSNATFQITGATAADFSPDSLKAFIVAGSTLYVYSKLDALRTVHLGAPADAVSFLSEGAISYVAGGAPSSATVWRTCDNGSADTVGLPATPSFIRTLPDATRMLALTSPTVDIIKVNTGPTGPSGCTPAVSNTVSSFNLGQGDFVAKQLIISPDGSTAYIITSNLASILVFNIAGETSSAISLAGNATALTASLTPDGTLLYVGASDGTLHVVDTVAGGDIQQISFSATSLCQNSVGQPAAVACYPDLVAVKP